MTALKFFTNGAIYDNSLALQSRPTLILDRPTQDKVMTRKTNSSEFPTFYHVFPYTPYGNIGKYQVFKKDTCVR